MKELADLELTETIEGWKKLRDDIRERERLFRELIAEDRLALEILEGNILDKFRTLKIRSANIEGMGTAYTSKRTTAKVESPEEFFSFVLETGRTELLFARASDKAVEEYIEMSKVPPPGVKVETADRLNFRAKQ